MSSELNGSDPPRLPEDSPYAVVRRPGPNHLRKYDGIAMRLVDFNRLFDTSPITPVIANHFDVTLENERKTLDSLIYTHYEGDSLNSVPECHCGATRGAGKAYSICPRCQCPVVTVSESKLVPLLWLAPPEGVDVFIHPQMWSMLSKALTHGNVNGLQWMTDPNMVVGREPHSNIRTIQSIMHELAIPRGINNFYKHFDTIVEHLFSNNVVSTNTKQQKEDLYQFVQFNRSKIFCNYLPLPSRTAFVTERSATGSFTDMTIRPAIDAVRTISSTINPMVPYNDKKLQSLAMQANRLMAQYHQEFMGKTLTGKPGFLRHRTFGSPLRFTFRAVISALAHAHDPNELHIPWGVAVSTYQYHIQAHLSRMTNPDTGRPYSANEMIGLLRAHTHVYHPTIAEIFRKMIDESPYMGLPVLLNRNPTLDRGSIQRFFITKIFDDPSINAIAMSVLCLVAPNAD